MYMNILAVFHFYISLKQSITFIDVNMKLMVFMLDITDFILHKLQIKVVFW